MRKKRDKREHQPPKPPPSTTDAELAQRNRMIESRPTVKPHPSTQSQPQQPFAPTPQRPRFASNRDRLLYEERQAEIERRSAAERAAYYPDAHTTRHDRGPISGDQLNRALEADSPRPRDAVDQRHAAERAPADRAEAQLALLPRCPICGKPVAGRVPRDRQGRPRHHRCPP